jgi:hypothetical protein
VRQISRSCCSPIGAPFSPTGGRSGWHTLRVTAKGQPGRHASNRFSPNWRRSPGVLSGSFDLPQGA